PPSSAPPPSPESATEPEIAAAPEAPVVDSAPEMRAPTPAEITSESTLAASEDREDGPVRRSLIRAQFPRAEGQPPAPRANPEFTVHSLHNRSRNGNHSHRGNSSFRGPMRFGRDNGHGQPDGSGRPHGQRHRRRRGGKKHQ